MNTFHDERFVFDTDFEFAARTGKNAYFAGEGDLITVRPGNHMWETNFVPDLAAIELKSWGDRGAGGTNIMFVLADGTMHAHISEMPVGTYKKGHRHGPGFHVMCVTGHGYSLLWFDGDKDFRRLDWHFGVVFPPADQQFHQHFNASQHPARYLATGVGGLRYPLTLQQRRSLLGVNGEKGAVSLSIKEGGDQIEYEDQDKRIHPLWLDEMRKNGVTPRMQKYFPDDGARRRPRRRSRGCAIHGVSPRDAAELPAPGSAAGIARSLEAPPPPDPPLDFSPPRSYSACMTRRRRSNFTLGWLMSLLDKRSFGLIMLMCAVVAVLPGVSIIAGLLLIIIAVQMIEGRPAPAFPDGLATARCRRSISRPSFGGFCRR